MTEPRDLHELLRALGPKNGWQYRHNPGLWRDLGGDAGQYIEAVAPGNVLVHGRVSVGGPKFYQRLRLGDVVEFFEKLDKEGK